MDYRKEKNLLIASDNGVIKGQYDWTTDTFYGTKGTPIKTMPAAFKGSLYHNMIVLYRHIGRIHTTKEAIARAIDHWERLISIGLYTEDTGVLFETEDRFPSLKKDFVEFVKSNGGVLTKYSYVRYQYSKMPEYDMLNENNKCRVERAPALYPDIEINWYVKALLRLQLEDYDYLDCYSDYTCLNYYYKRCIEMGEQPTITKNFLITISKRFHLYQNWKAEHMNENLLRNNDLKELYYENDTYTVFPLTSVEEFHAEAEAQHNCVERLYMEQVASGKTHVVVVRKKDAPETSLVTCEIDNNWQIRQYLRIYNQTPCQSELNFKKELISYLNSLSKK